MFWANYSVFVFFCSQFMFTTQTRQIYEQELQHRMWSLPLIGIFGSRFLHFNKAIIPKQQKKTVSVLEQSISSKWDLYTCTLKVTFWFQLHFCLSYALDKPRTEQWQSDRWITVWMNASIREHERPWITNLIDFILLGVKLWTKQGQTDDSIDISLYRA